MLLSLAGDSARLVFTRPFRAIVMKSVMLTVVLLASIWFALQGVVDWAVKLDIGWLEVAIQIATGVGLFIVLGFLIAPIASLFAGLYLDDVAELVERERYPHDKLGRELPLLKSLLTTVRFLVVVVLVNSLALLLVFAFGLGLIIFFVANAYLLGREYLSLAASRHMSPQDVKRLRSEHALTIFAAGFIVALVMTIPVINLFAPIFGTIFFLHVYKWLAGSRAAVPQTV